MSLQIKCHSCSSTHPLSYKFCPKCGEKFAPLNPREIIGNVPQKYQEAYGIWSVTTEGDCEGRSVRQLGTFEGHLDEIAQRLSGQCYYSLQFKPAKSLPQIPEAPDNGSVNVTLDIDSKTWDMNSERRVEVMEYILRDRPTRVEKGTSYASVNLAWGTGEDDE